MAVHLQRTDTSTDTTLGSSDALIPTQNAVKTYVDTATGSLSSTATFDVVVSATGAYTTLGAAIASGATSIFVQDGTYAESTIASSVDGLHIVGESTNAVLEFGNRDITLSGDHVRIDTIGMTHVDGTLILSGDHAIVQGCVFDKSGDNEHIVSLGSGFELSGAVITDSSTDTSSPNISLQGRYAKIANNSISYATSGATIATAYISGTGTCYHAKIIGNYVDKGSSGGATIAMQLADGIIESNTMVSAGVSGVAILMGDYNEMIIGNYFNGYDTVFTTEGNFDIRDFMIDGNTFFGNNRSISLTNAHDVIISGNYLSSANPSLLNACANMIVTSNHLRIAGFTIDSTCTNFTITSNTLTNGAVFTDSSTGTQYWGNVGARNVGESWVTPPGSATATGIVGQRAYDSNYLYICTATNTWQRVSLSTW